MAQRPLERCLSRTLGRAACRCGYNGVAANRPGYRPGCASPEGAAGRHLAGDHRSRVPAPRAFHGYPRPRVRGQRRQQQEERQR